LLLPGVEEITVEGGADPDLAASIVDGYRALADDGRAPILEIYATAIEGIVASQEGDDTDGDGLTDTAEAQIGAQVVLAVGAVTGDFQVSNLDPANPESVPGVSDSETAATALNEIATRYTQVRLNDTNYDELKPAAEESLENLRRAQEDAKWGFDFEAIADHVFGGDAERARQVVGLFEANCARCHTSGYSAGLPYTQEAGSGAFGPALYDGRPAVQFLSDEDLRDFLIEGSVANQPYGVNGMGKQNAPMPGFGETLAEDDLLDLATWLRAGDLTGRSDS
jgi:mono/diheme cytochrome c family protein